MQFNSKIFGQIEINPDEVFFFPSGLIGFPEEKKFFLLKVVSDNLSFPLEILHSFENPNLAFFVTDPSFIVHNYSILSSPEEVKDIEVQDVADVAVRVILRCENGKFFANLLAPIIINARNKKGKHLILEGSEELLDVELLLKRDETSPEKSQKHIYHNK